MKGKLPPSIKAMLAKAGLVEGKDYTTVGIEGFDPLVHIELPGLAGFPGYKSNEPGTLERAGISFTLFDPSKDGIPGSFGIIYTNAGFLDRASDGGAGLRAGVHAGHGGRAWPTPTPPRRPRSTSSTPTATRTSSRPRASSSAGRPSPGWSREFTPKGQPVGLIDPADLQSQIDAYDAVGIFTEKPTIEGTYDSSLIAGVYGPDGKVVWPTG